MIGGKRIWIILPIGLLLLAAVVWVVVRPATVDEESLRIGVVTSQTGVIAPYGQNVLNGIQLAVKEINNGPPPHVEIIVEDDGSTTNGAVSAFRKLINVHRLPVVIGPVGSSQAMVCSPIANENEVVLLSPAASTPDFTSPNDFTFRNRPSAIDEVTEMARVARDALGYERGAVIYVNNDFGDGNRRAFVEQFRRIGGIIDMEEAFDQGATNMRAQLTKIAGAQPDFIYLLGQVVESGYVLKQARELGITLPFLSHTSIQGADVLEIAGPAADGVIYTTTAYDPDTMGTRTRAFEKRYQTEYGKQGDMFAANGYDAVFVVRQAILNSSYDGPQIRDALGRLTHHGAAGLTTFDENGDVQRPVVLRMIRNGAFVTITEEDLRNGPQEDPTH